MAALDPKPAVDTSCFADIEYAGKHLQLEYTWVLPDNTGPLVVFLHEGLGSLAMWRAFPRRLCETLNCRGLIYSRCGYGRSSPLWPQRQWPVEFMHVEAREVLPRFLTAVGVDEMPDPPVLLGHSDGASVALIYACSFPDKLSGLITMAPHVLVEDITVESIAATRQKFIDTDLPQRLAKYHRDAAEVFWGWADVWLSVAFRKWNIEPILQDLACPTLAVQGYEDEYGTMLQVDRIQAASKHVRVLKLPHCGHAPHLDQPEVLIEGAAQLLAVRSSIGIPPHL